MNINSRFAVGTQHQMAKGLLTVVGYYENNGIIYMNYRLNDDETVHANKYVNVISIIYKWQKRQQQNGSQAQQRRATMIANATQVLRTLTMKRSLKFGIELEICVRSVAQLRAELEQAGIPVVTPNSTHEVVRGWKIVRDSSIRTTKMGVELVSPPSTDFEQLKIVCEVLKKVGATVNNSCGFHVHHDINDLLRKQIIRIYNFYKKYQKLINRGLKVSRENNPYCRDLDTIIDRVNACETKSELLDNIAGRNVRGYYANCRYYVLNLRSFLHYGTIEFRQHHGSVKFEEISNWILFTHKIIDRATIVGNDVEPLQCSTDDIAAYFQEMVMELGISQTDLEKYLKKTMKVRA